jgi:6,7-dimethyl-8-ribityllumazine synthase
MGDYSTYEGELDATGMRFAIVASRFNRDVTEPLCSGAEKTLRDHGAADVHVAWVPGAFELPLVAKRFAQSGAVDAVVCIGAVIRGETAHFDHVAGQAAAGIRQAAVETGVAVIFGVLATDTTEQALSRAGGKAGNKGWDAAMAAMETASVLERLPKEAG